MPGLRYGLGVVVDAVGAAEDENHNSSDALTKHLPHARFTKRQDRLRRRSNFLASIGFCWFVVGMAATVLVELWEPNQGRIILSVVALTATAIAAMLIGGSLLVRLQLGSPMHVEPAAISEARMAAQKAEDEIAGIEDLMGMIRANRKQMAAYDILARRHGSTSHRASLTAMGIGLIMVGAGLAVAWYAEDSATKYSAAIIAATATAAGGFIAQTFIRVQQRAQDQMQFYFRQPLDTSYLLTAERLASQLPEPAKGEQYARIITAALAQTGVTNGRPETKELPADQAPPPSTPDVPDASA